MITITYQAPLIVIETDERVIYQGVQDFAYGFDVQNGIAYYYAIFYAPITDFVMNGTPITTLEEFEAAIQSLTTP